MHHWRRSRWPLPYCPPGWRDHQLALHAGRGKIVGCETAQWCSACTRRVRLCERVHGCENEPKTMQLDSVTDGANDRMYASHQVPGSSSVVASTGNPTSVWSAAFAGTGSGTETISANTAKCESTQVVSATATALTLKWVQCSVTFDSGRGAEGTGSGADANVTWVEHKNSSCGGQVGLCLHFVFWQC
jgi:hypothetical protein